MTNKHPDVERRASDMPASSKYPWAVNQGGVFKTLKEANDFAVWHEAYLNGALLKKHGFI